jgi:hypothetical protein
MIDATTLVNHVKDDIEHLTPTLTRLLLLRSLVATKILARDLDRARTLACDLDRDLAHTLARDLDLRRALDLDRDLARTLNLSRDRDRNSDLDLGRDLALNLDLACTLARTLNCILDRDLAHHFACARALDRDRALALALARTLDCIRDLDLDLSLVMGNALSQALTRTYCKVHTETWSADFAQEFINVIGIDETEYIVSLDMLAEKLQSGREALLKIIEPLNGDVRSHPRASRLAHGLIKLQATLRRWRCQYLPGNAPSPPTPQLTYGSRLSAWPSRQTRAMRIPSATRSVRLQQE